MKMWRKWLTFFTVMIALVVLGACHQPTPAPAPPPPSHGELHVYIVPETVVAHPGESIELEVKVEPGQNGLSAGEIEVSFDPSLVVVMNLNPGSLLSSNPLVGIKEIDNQAGRIRFALGRVGETPVPTSTGVFATIEVEAVRSIQGQVCQLTRASFCNEDFEDISEIVLSEPLGESASRPVTTIVMMGCSTACLEDMAVAFSLKGASTYLGWDRFVSIEHVDEATIYLVQKLLVDELTVEKAGAATMAEKGRDPVFNAILKYYPQKNGARTIQELITGKTDRVGQLPYT